MSKDKFIMFLIVLFCLIVSAGLVYRYFEKNNIAINNDTTKKITINFWGLYDESNLYEGLIQEFQSKNPNVSVFYKKYTNPAIYEEDLLSSLASGKGPDVIYLPQGWLIKHLDLLSPLKTKWTSDFKYANPMIFRDTFVPATHDLIREVFVNSDKPIKGEFVYGVPLNTDTLALMYNKEIVRNYPEIKMDANWNADNFAFQDNIQIDTTKNNNSLTHSAISMGRIDNISRGVDILNLLLLQYGSDFYDLTYSNIILDKSIKIGEVPFDSSVNALKLFTSFAKDNNINYSWDKQIMTTGDEMNAFVVKKVDMIYIYPYQINEVHRLISQYLSDPIYKYSVINENDVGLTTVPQVVIRDMNNKILQTSNVALANNFPLAVTKKDDESIEYYSWKFIDFLVSPSSQMYLFRNGNKITSRKDLLDTEEKERNILEPFVSQNRYAKSVDLPDSAKVKSLYDKYIIDILEGRLTEGEAIKKINTGLNCILEQAKKIEGYQDVECTGR